MKIWVLSIQPISHKQVRWIKPTHIANMLSLLSGPKKSADMNSSENHQDITILSSFVNERGFSLHLNIHYTDKTYQTLWQTEEIRKKIKDPCSLKVCMCCRVGTLKETIPLHYYKHDQEMYGATEILHTWLSGESNCFKPVTCYSNTSDK